MTRTQIIITIALVVLGTVLTRLLPFILFPEGKETPFFIVYLGKVLPPACLGLLVIYCYKGVDISAGNHGVPAFLAGALVVLLHKWKKKMFLSIVGGTALYLILLRCL